MQPSPAVLQLSPCMEPCVNPRLKEICAGLFPPPVLLTLRGTWRTCSYHLARGVFPKLLHNSCCRPSLKTEQIFFSFFFILLCLRSKFMNVHFLNRSLQLVPRTVPYLILVCWPSTVCEIKWAHLFIRMRNLLFFLSWYCLCSWFELCLKTLSVFKEPCKWRFIIQLQSLSPVFFVVVAVVVFWQVCCVQTAFVRLRGRTHCPVCLSSGVSYISLKNQVLWLHVGAFNGIPQSIQHHEIAEHAVICVTTAANMMLVQQKHSSLICSAVRAHWVQPRVAK